VGGASLEATTWSVETPGAVSMNAASPPAGFPAMGNQDRFDFVTRHVILTGSRRASHRL
jgi:hypothetical protein